MEILLDTPVLIWWMLDSSGLSKHAADLLADSDTRVFISAVVAWELSIKVNAGKIQPASLITMLEDALTRQAFLELPITLDHAVRASLLPLHDRDPFDRLLVAQAQSLKLPILSSDRRLDEYDVRRVW